STHRTQPRTQQQLQADISKQHQGTLHLSPLQIHQPLSLKPTPRSYKAEHSLRCILINTSSNHRQAIELWNLIDTTSPDVAFLTETWLNPSSALDIANPDGYKSIRRDCTN
ncbi:hypothetical protein NDU88_006410, partial [Pleurodeles waltl]